MLFMIGLEIDLKKIVRAGNVILVTSAAQILGCFALGARAVSRSSAFRSATAASTRSISPPPWRCRSTVIIVKVLYDKRELDTLPGRITLGVLVLQDLFAILFLAIQPSLNDLTLRCRAGVGLRVAMLLAQRAAVQPLHAAASLPPDRAPAGARAGRRAGLVLRGRRVRRVSRPVPRDGRADRRRFALDLPLRARRHRQGHVAARLLHHAVLRRARHDDPAADILGARPRAHSRRFHAGRAGS